jgi:hypothetical protein
MIAKERIWEAGHEYGCPKIEVKIPIGAMQWSVLSAKTKEKIVERATAAANEAIREAVAKVMTEPS